jgi:hypothetical protein
MIKFIVETRAYREYEYSREQLEAWFPAPEARMSDRAYAEWLFNSDADTTTADGATFNDVINAAEPSGEYSEPEAELVDWLISGGAS